MLPLVRLTGWRVGGGRWGVEVHFNTLERKREKNTNKGKNKVCGEAGLHAVMPGGNVLHLWRTMRLPQHPPLPSAQARPSAARICFTARLSSFKLSDTERFLFCWRCIEWWLLNKTPLHPLNPPTTSRSDSPPGPQMLPPPAFCCEMFVPFPSRLKSAGKEERAERRPARFLSLPRLGARLRPWPPGCSYPGTPCPKACPEPNSLNWGESRNRNSRVNPWAGEICHVQKKRSNCIQKQTPLA